MSTMNGNALEKQLDFFAQILKEFQTSFPGQVVISEINPTCFIVSRNNGDPTLTRVKVILTAVAQRYKFIIPRQQRQNNQVRIEMPVADISHEDEHPIGEVMIVDIRETAEAMALSLPTCTLPTATP